MDQPDNQLPAIFLEAAEIADAQKREDYLNAACAGDAVLRKEVEELLEAEAGIGHFLPDHPKRIVAEEELSSSAWGAATHE